MLYIFLLLPIVSSYNVLIWNPTLGLSHVRFLGNIASILHKDGHNVTVLSPIIDPHTESFGTTENVHKIEYLSPYLGIDAWAKMSLKSADIWMENSQGLSWEDWNRYANITNMICKGMITDASLISQMRDSKFDIAYFEVFDLCGVSMAEVFGIKKTIVVGALGEVDAQHHATGIPMITSFVPGWMTQNSDDMTFLQRYDNLLINLEMQYHQWNVNRHLHDIMKEYDPNFPHPVALIKAQTGAILLNSHEFVESPRLRSNMVHYIGGAAIYPPKNLSRDINDLLDLRSHNVIFSLGSFTKSCDMPEYIKTEFIEAFSSLPDVTFIWKYEDCENDSIDFSKYENVVKMNWIPQTDLLADPRVNLLISHAGMNSILEASFRGKPLVTIPLFADQIMNSRNAVRRGLSIQIERYRINRSDLIDAITTILQPDSAYTKKAQLVAELLKGREEEYRNSIRKWCRIVAEHGQLEHLPLISGRMSFIQLYSIDVMLFMLLQSIAAVAVVGILTKMVVSRVRINVRVETPK